MSSRLRDPASYLPLGARAKSLNLSTHQALHMARARVGIGRLTKLIQHDGICIYNMRKMVTNHHFEWTVLLSTLASDKYQNCMRLLPKIAKRA